MNKQEFDAFIAARDAASAERQRQRDERGQFATQARAMREARARGDLAPMDPAREIPTLDSYYREARAVEVASEEEAERQRVASLDPRNIWYSTLPMAERQRVDAWQNVNHLPWPVSSATLKDIEASKRATLPDNASS